MRSTRCDVLLVAADWRSRALLLAQLQESGCAVIAAPSLRHAYRALIGQRVHPRLILLDTTGDEDATPPTVEQLGDLAVGIPLILLTGVNEVEDWQPIRERAAYNLRKPVSVGDVAEAVRRGLAKP